jgi:hypothetical protein
MDARTHTAWIDQNVPARPYLLKQHHLQPLTATTWTPQAYGPVFISIASHDQIPEWQLLGQHVARDDFKRASRRKGCDQPARGNSFRVVAEELLDKMRREGRAPATLTKTEWLLEFAYDVIGDRPVAKITAPELLAVLRKIEARGTYETARRLRSTCGMVFR